MNKLFAALLMSCFLLTACNNELNEPKQESSILGLIGAESYINNLSILLNSSQMTKGSELPDEVYAELFIISQDYLNTNNITFDDYKEFCDEGDEYGYITIIMAMSVTEAYNASISQTKGFIGGCILQGLGISALVTNKASLKAIIKVVGKAVAKKAIPYIGWGLFIGETVWCLLD